MGRKGPYATYRERHTASMELVFQADRLLRKGDLDGATEKINAATKAAPTDEERRGAITDHPIRTRVFFENPKNLRNRINDLNASIRRARRYQSIG